MTQKQEGAGSGMTQKQKEPGFFAALSHDTKK
jgi:hypothetical protein